MLSNWGHQMRKKLILFPHFFVQKHVFFLFLKSRFLCADLVSQSLPIFDFHTILLCCSEPGLNSCDLLVPLIEVNIISFSLPTPSFKFLLLGCFYSSLLPLRQRRLGFFRLNLSWSSLRLLLDNLWLSFLASLIEVAKGVWGYGAHFFSERGHLELMGVSLHLFIWDGEERWLSVEGVELIISLLLVGSERLVEELWECWLLNFLQRRENLVF